MGACPHGLVHISGALRGVAMEMDDFVVTFFTSVLRAENEHPSWRLGQTYFNVLHTLRPDLANKIRATYLDPFYINSAIPAFLKWLVDTIVAEDTGDSPVAPEEPTDGSDG